MLDSVAVFMAMSTQWNWVTPGMAGAFRVGLKYEVIAPTAAGLGITCPPRVFTDLRVMEDEALKVWDKRHG